MTEEQLKRSIQGMFERVVYPLFDDAIAQLSEAVARLNDADYLRARLAWLDAQNTPSK